jgi:5'-nucleotidase
LTIEVPVSVKPVPSDVENITQFAVSGTPADCVKLAISQLLDEKPDLVISGINHGSNASINVIYSGTIGAAIEGALHGIPSIGFSLCDHDADADFEPSLPYFEQIIAKTINSEMPKDICLNVNAPKGEVKGIRACRQAEGRWANDFGKTPAPRANDYYWLIGDFMFLNDNDMNADQCAIENGYITVVPLQFDMTAYKAIEFCKQYETEA